MRYLEQQPTGELERFVECFWFLAQDRAAGLGSLPVERLLPVGSIEIVLHHGSPFRQCAEGEPARLLPRGVIAGQQTGPIFIQPEGAVATMGVRFFPGGAYPFFGTRLDAITGRLTSFEEVWGGEGARFEEDLMEARDDSGRVRVAERFLLARLSRAERQDPPIEEAARQIRRVGGRVSVSKLGGSLGLSPRQMERRFGAALGIGPKSLCRVVRFQALLRRLARRGRADWAGLAAECGYADQSHLVHEVRRLSGATPRELVVLRRPESRREGGFTLEGASGLRVCPAGIGA